MDTYQCVDNANCTENMGALLCTCNAAFYPDGDYCARRKGPEKPCYGYGECIENAECTSESGGLCRCNDGYFHAEDGTCDKRIPLGETTTVCCVTYVVLMVVVVTMVVAVRGIS